MNRLALAQQGLEFRVSALFSASVRERRLQPHRVFVSELQNKPREALIGIMRSFS
jgi:hypothetical protein